MTSATMADLDAAVDAELSSDSEDDDEAEEEGASKKKGKGKEVEKKEEKLKPGMARIVRDESGNVVSIIVGGQHGEEVEEKIVEPSRAAAGEGSDSEDEDESDDEDEFAVMNPKPKQPKQKKAKKAETSPWGAPMKDWTVKNADEVPQFDDDEDLEMREAEEVKTRKPAAVRQGIEVGGPVKRVAAKSEVIRGAFCFFPFSASTFSFLLSFSY
jgi:hypothetical protein